MKVSVKKTSLPDELWGPDAGSVSTASTATSQPPPGQAERLAQHETEIDDPLTGEVVRTDDVDGLIEMFERLDRENRRVYYTMCRIREALGKLTEGDAVTRRLKGRRKAAKVVMPDVKWEQSIVRECWQSYPSLRDEYLKIESIGVRMREYQKLVNTSGVPEIETFRNMLTAACKGRVGLPTVTVER